MAFTANEIQNQQWVHFSYFASGGANGVISESLAIGEVIQLAEIRVHGSAVFVSVEDFTVYISSVNGSAYNLKLVSQAMNTVQDYLFQPESAMLLLSDDQLVFGLSLASAVNTIGINVIGWAVRG